LLSGTGLRLRTGPVVMVIRSPVPEVAAGLALHYSEHPLAHDDEFADFHVGVMRPTPWRALLKPQVVFELDGTRPFNPLPGDQGFPMLEWGMNWCLSSLSHQYLTLHAAVLERGGKALVLPAPSGSGKSTLCAGLLFRGWRLLSDELAVIDPARGQLLPVPRPVSLKNASINLIRRFAPEAEFGPVVTETLKGEVTHFKPPVDAVARAAERADPGWVVLPRYKRGATACLNPLGKASALMKLIANAFNYDVHGQRGFELLADMVDRSQCYTFEYGDLEDAVACFDRLTLADSSVRSTGPGRCSCG
jgi:HprK-related kinase A